MTQVLIDRATLEQLVGALEGVRLCTPPAQRPMVREAITAGRAALANEEPTKGPITNHIEMANKALRQAADHSYKIAMATRYARTLPKATL